MHDVQLCRLGHGQGQGEIENSQIQLMACLELPRRMLTVDVHGCEDAAGSDRRPRLDHPDWTGTLPQQVHVVTAQQSVEPIGVLAGPDYQVVAVAQDRTDDTQERYTGYRLRRDINALLEGR